MLPRTGQDQHEPSLLAVVLIVNAQWSVMFDSLLEIYHPDTADICNQPVLYLQANDVPMHPDNPSGINLNKTNTVNRMTTTVLNRRYVGYTLTALSKLRGCCAQLKIIRPVKMVVTNHCQPGQRAVIKRRLCGYDR